MHSQFAKGGLSYQRQTLRLRHAMHRGVVVTGIPEMEEPTDVRRGFLQGHVTHIKRVDRILQETDDLDVRDFSNDLSHIRLLRTSPKNKGKCSSQRDHSNAV